MCGFAYVIAMIVYQIGGLITGEAPFGIFSVIAIVLLAGLLYLLFRPFWAETRSSAPDGAYKRFRGAKTLGRSIPDNSS